MKARIIAEIERAQPIFPSIAAEMKMAAVLIAGPE